MALSVYPFPAATFHLSTTHFVVCKHLSEIVAIVFNLSWNKNELYFISWPDKSINEDQKDGFVSQGNKSLKGECYDMRMCLEPRCK